MQLVSELRSYATMISLEISATVFPRHSMTLWVDPGL